MLSNRAMVEMFHLVFLRALAAKGEDKGLFALKGGCNLRFYFGSPRYSEGIDLDAAVIARETLQKKIEKLLLSPIVTYPLKAQGLELVDVTAPKQTDTTQRWKAGLRGRGGSVPVRTKIEFSRRDSIEGALFEPVNAEVGRRYALPPFLATHYSSHKAALQKIQALAGRSEPQARDVFDLHLLLAQPSMGDFMLPEGAHDIVLAALDQAMSISFDAYASGVIAFLEPEYVTLYEGSASWDAMQGHVVEWLEKLGRRP